MKKQEIIATILSIVSFLLVMIGIFSSQNYYYFLDISSKTLLLFGVFTSILFFVFYLVDLFDPLIENFYSKLIISLFVLSLTTICISEASGIINEIYSGVDASIFLYSKVFLSGIIFFKKTFPFLLILLILIIIFIIFNLINIYIENKSITHDMSWTLGILKGVTYLFSISTLTIFSWNMNYTYFNNDDIKLKAYLISRHLDFYSYPDKNIQCTTNEFIIKGTNFIYLDNQQKRIMIDKSNIPQMTIIEILDFSLKKKDRNINLEYSPSYTPNLKILNCLQNEA